MSETIPTFTTGPNELTRLCPGCNQEKPHSLFNRKRKSVSYWCKVCSGEYGKQYYLANFEKSQEYSKIYYQENKETIINQSLVRYIRIKRSFPEKVMFKAARDRAKRKGIDFSIAVSDIIMPTHCPILGLALKPNYEHPEDDSPSLDRVDSSRGYVPGNVAVISHRANAIKGNGTAEEHEQIAKWIRNHLGELCAKD